MTLLRLGHKANFAFFTQKHTHTVCGTHLVTFMCVQYVCSVCNCSSLVSIKTRSLTLTSACVCNNIKILVFLVWVACNIQNLMIYTVINFIIRNCLFLSNRGKQMYMVYP